MTIPEPRPPRSIASGVPVIILAIVVVFIALSLYLNQRCVDRFAASIAVFPNSELVTDVSNFLGLQERVYRTTDSVDTVQAWINQYQSSAMRRAVQTGNFYDIQSNPYVLTREGDYTYLTYRVMCPSGLDV